MNKLRLFLLLTICALTGISVNAQQVSKAKAQSIAAKFMQEHNMGAVDAAKTVKAPRTRANASQDNAAYYVFNSDKQNGGWVIVSGDDRTEQVLGYSDKGNFDPTNVPENMQAWLDQYVEEIAMLDEGVITIDRSQSNVHPKGGSAVSPLLTSQWDQSAPFNLRCPTYNGNYCVTGCTATAMAQIMYYHKWPSSTSQTIHGYTQSDDVNYTMHGTTYPALTTTTFNWNIMKDYYSSSETSETDNSNNAVAKLMRYCGQAVEMKYGVSSSSAVSSSEVYVDYFRYSPKARKLFRVDYSYSQWENFILTELRANRPVIYDGAKYNGGHSFVCDGYDGNSYYHFNWGWRGSHDGYFLLTALNPKGGGIGSAIGNNGYMIGNDIIIGLEPNTVSTSERNSVARCFELKIGDNTTYTRSNSSEPFLLYLNARIWNEMPVSRTYDFGWGVYKADGFTPLLQYTFTATHSLGAHEQSESIIRTFQFGQNFANGTYYLRPICRESGNNQWLPCHYSGLNYIKAVINGNTLTLTAVNKAINNTQETTDGVLANINAYSSLKKVNRPLTVLVKVKNNSLADNIFFYLWANNERVGANSINLSSGSSGFVSISYTPTSSGTNNLIVTGDKSGNEVYCTGSVNVEPLTEASLLVRSSVPAANASNQVAGNKLTLNASITNRKTSVYHDYIFARLYKKTLLGNVEEGEIQRVIEIPASNSQTTSSINQVFDFTNLSKGKYLVKFYYYSLDEEKMALQTATYEILGVIPGDVNGDGIVSSVDITALYNYLLNNDASDIVNGDQDGDGIISSVDITVIYNILLGN